MDIDGGPELEIVEAIAARDELAALVDEIFFECGVARLNPAAVSHLCNHA